MQCSEPAEVGLEFHDKEDSGNVELYICFTPASHVDRGWAGGWRRASASKVCPCGAEKCDLRSGPRSLAWRMVLAARIRSPHRKRSLCSGSNTFGLVRALASGVR